jgi:hypothetical protein
LRTKFLKKRRNPVKTNFSKIKQEIEYLTVKELSEKYPVKLLFEIVGLPRCSYYKRLKRAETPVEQENYDISRLILDYDIRLNHILGYRRMTLFINRLNRKSYGVKRIRRIMRTLDISSKIRRKRKGYIKVKPQITAENILNRDFTATRPN